MAGGDNGTLADLKYNAASKSLELQRASVDEMRTRTATLLAAANIASAFLASGASKGNHGFPIRFLWAVIPFGLCVVMCVVVLFPRLHWSSGLNSDSFDVYASEPIEVTKGKLAHDLETLIAENNGRLNWMGFEFSVAAIALLWSILAWIALIE